VPTAEVKTTADVYAAPMLWRNVTTRAAKAQSTPKLMYTLTRSQKLAEGFSFPMVLTTPHRAMPDETRAKLLQELAELSIDPNSMDRDSEVDIWGFDSP
jgi:hypothetical protein